MNETLPFVSIVVAARPDLAEVPSVSAARALNYPADRLEIIVARGRQPSAQRNAAVREARGEWIYFLDDDSRPSVDALRKAAVFFVDEGVVMVGGPNLCPPEAPAVEQGFALGMGSTLAFWTSAARYRSIGKARVSSEKELILCNLMVRRAQFLEAGGFDELLYPNEENALMDQLGSGGKRLIYHPGMVVWRRPRSTWKAYWRMLRTYGRGRAEQFRRHPTAGSLMNFGPPLFLAYLVCVPLLPLLLWFPLGFYAVAILVESIRLGWSRPAALWRLPIVLASVNICYGFGFWHGMFTRFGGRDTSSRIDIRLERIAI